MRKAATLFLFATFELLGVSAQTSVTQIIAGSNVTMIPTSGTGVVTVNPPPAGIFTDVQVNGEEARHRRWRQTAGFCRTTRPRATLSRS